MSTWNSKIRKGNFFLPIDIIHDPVKHIKIKINCYSSTAKHLAYKSTFSKNDKVKHTNAWQCHYCSNYYGQKGKYDRHLEH